MKYCWELGGLRADMYAFAVLLLSFVTLVNLQRWSSARRKIGRKKGQRIGEVSHKPSRTPDVAWVTLALRRRR